MNINTNFQPWIFMYHHEKIIGLSMVIEKNFRIKYYTRFLKLFNNWDKIGGVNNKTLLSYA